MGKVFVLTGATSGIGYELSKQLVSRGVNLIFIARDRAKAEHLTSELKSNYGQNVDYFLADLSDLEQVRMVAERINNVTSHIDIFWGNAGVFAKKRILTAQNYELDLAVNFLANVLLTSLLLPKILKSNQGRIFFTNSVAHKWCRVDLDDLNWEKKSYRPLMAYCQSKLMQILAVKVFSELLKDRGIAVNAVHPGNVWTNIVVNYDGAARFMRFLMRLVLRSPQNSAQHLANLALEKDLQDFTGKYFKLSKPSKPTGYLQDKQLIIKAFRTGLEMVGLTKDYFLKDLNLNYKIVEQCL